MQGPFKIKSQTCNIAAEAGAAARAELAKKLLIWVPVWTCLGLIALGFLVFLIQAVRTCLRSQSKWAFAVTALYGALVVAVFLPIVFYISLWLGDPDDTEFRNILEFYLAILSSWQGWLYIVISTACELSLLAIPVEKTRERPSPRKGVRTTALATGALFALLVTGIVWSVTAAIFADGAIEEFVILGALIFVVANWLFWACLFRSFARNMDENAFVRRLMKWLLRGSILELLIAVPSHIIVRQRDVCCAHGITALGLATGLAVMLISFGPGIYFLYAERIKRKSNNKTKNQNQNQGDIPE